MEISSQNEQTKTVQDKTKQKMTFKHLEDTNKKLASSIELQYAGVLEEK